MAKRATTEEFKQKILKKYDGKVEILSEFNGGKSPIDFVYHCETHGDIFGTMNAKNISSNKSFQPCKKCRDEKRRCTFEKMGENRFNKEYHYKKLKEKVEYHGGVLITEKYTKAKDQYKFKCSNPDHPVFTTTADDIVNDGHWCPYCCGRKGDFHRKYKEIIESKNGELLNEYSGSYNHLKVRCKTHDWIWRIMPMNIDKGRWCPVCSMPDSEKVVFDILKDLGCLFEIQKTFDDLISDDNSHLRYDFSIHDENNNVYLIIESDGNDHRTNTKSEKRMRLQGHDRIKDEYCKNNNINMLRIPYYEGMSYMDYKEYI